MQIRITKREQRNQLACVRADGTRTTANLGPGLPITIWRTTLLKGNSGCERGFFGNIAAGYSIEALSDKEVMKSLSGESWVAEILARALASATTGACRPDQFSAQVNAELAHLSISGLENVTPQLVFAMLAEFQKLTARYESLSNGDSLDLVFD